MNQNCNCNPQEDYLNCPVCPPNPDIPLPPPRPLPPMPGFPCPPPPKPGCGCGDSTPNYGLPLWKASDVTSWLMQLNGAMLRIDTIMHDLALRTGINGLPDDLVTTVSKLCQDMEQMKCMVGELGNKTANMELLMQNMNTSFSAMKTDIASMQLSLTNFDTRLMTVDSANQQNKNDITLIKTDLNMLSQTVNALQQNFTQYQMATNQTLAELQSQINDNSDEIDDIKAWEKDPSNKLRPFKFFPAASLTYNDSNGNTELLAGSSLADAQLSVNNIAGGLCQVCLRTPTQIALKIVNPPTAPSRALLGCELLIPDNIIVNSPTVYEHAEATPYILVSSTGAEKSRGFIPTCIAPIFTNNPNGTRTMSGIKFYINSAFSNPAFNKPANFDITFETNDIIYISRMEAYDLMYVEGAGEQISTLEEIPDMGMDAVERVD